MSSASSGTLYLHYPCFDGLVSGAIATDYLETNHGWSIDRVVTVNYDLQGGWLDRELPSNAAVVDFLYHPAVTFWADHHATTFLSDEARRNFELATGDRILLYDRTAPSCAKLLWQHFGDVSSDPERYGEMAYWANRTDSADYETVEEAVFGASPAMRINSTLSLSNDSAYGMHLLHSMRTMTLAQIDEMQEVRGRAVEVRDRTEIGLRDVSRAVRIDRSGIAVFEARPSANAIINRYSAYCFFPEARYSVALIYGERDAKLTAMRNPWIEFESVDLGPIFRKYGGGGHQRIASLIIRADSGADPASIMAQVVAEISALDHHRPETERAIA